MTRVFQHLWNQFSVVSFGRACEHISVRSIKAAIFHKVEHADTGGLARWREKNPQTCSCYSDLDRVLTEMKILSQSLVRI